MAVGEAWDDAAPLEVEQLTFLEIGSQRAYLCVTAKKDDLAVSGQERLSAGPGGIHRVDDAVIRRQDALAVSACCRCVLAHSSGSISLSTWDNPVR